MNIAILVPMLGRPHHVAPLLASIRTTAPEARVLFLTTHGDDDVTAAIDAEGEVWIGSKHRSGEGAGADYQRKINEGYRLTSEPLLFLGASDLHFHPGWFEACTRHLAGHIGVVGTNDLTNKRTMSGKHSTHSLVTREYANLGTIDGQSGILCEAYDHSFCDDELIATARKRRAWAHATDAYVEHFHPMAQKSADDSVYQLGRSRFEADRRLFRQRCRTHRLQ